MKTKKEENGNLKKILIFTIIFLLIVILSKFIFYFIMPIGVYTIFHVISEFLTIMVGFFIFYVSNKSYRLTGSNIIRIIGWGFLAMAIIDIFHTIAFKGFPNPFFTPGSNAGIWFWLPARLIGAILIFISAIFSFKTLKPGKLNFMKFSVFSYVLIIIPLAIYDTYNQILPAMFIQGVGLTPLKIFLEYFVMALFGISAIIYTIVFLRNKTKTLEYFVIGLIASFFSELAFTMYSNVSDVFNLFGHILKLLAYVFFYYGIVLAFKQEKSHISKQNEK